MPLTTNSVVYDGINPDANDPKMHSQPLRNASALSSQLQQQVHHDIGVVLPTLYGILNNLGSPGSHIRLSHSELISEFRQVLASLEDSLATEIAGVEVQESSTCMSLFYLTIICLWY